MSRLAPGQIAAVCAARGWSRSRLVVELRGVARRAGQVLPDAESLGRMIRQWTSGQRQPGRFYAELLTEALGPDLARAVPAVPAPRAAAGVDGLDMRELAELRAQAQRVLARLDQLTEQLAAAVR